MLDKLFLNHVTMKIIPFVLLNLVLFTEASKILMVFNHFGRSHYFQGKALGKGLARAGHDVTMVSPFKDTESDGTKGYKEVILEGILKQIHLDTNTVRTERKGPYNMIQVLNFISVNYTLNTLENPTFQELLKTKEAYDVIILEDFFFLSLRALKCYFKAPLILFSPFAPTTYTNEVAGVPAPPSYVPNLWMGYSDSMTFWERSWNFLFNIFDTLNIYFIVHPVQNKIIEKYFPNCPKLEELNNDVAVILINNHESINAAIPSVPNTVNILGFHLKEKNTLPEDLKKYMDSSKNGVILFSFGSFAHPSQMDPKIKKSFLNSLGKLKENVLWKTDEENIPDLPKNIRLSQWLPQEDLLAHPNTKLFITHAGFVSTIETIYHAVPVLAFPLAGDQNANAARMVKLGIGFTSSMAEITEGKLDHFLYELLNNDTYRKNAKKRSDLLKDRPMKPMELAIYWVEYVIRHKGAHHLRISGLDLAFYQYYLLDVMAFWSTMVLIVLYLIYFIFKKVINICTTNKKVKTS